jgi:hypothetical protein
MMDAPKDEVATESVIRGPCLMCSCPGYITPIPEPPMGLGACQNLRCGHRDTVHKLILTKDKSNL